MLFSTLVLSTLAAVAAGQGMGDPITPCARDCYAQGALLYPVPDFASLCNQDLVDFLFTCAAPGCGADELTNLANYFTSACTVNNLPVVTTPGVTPASTPPTSTTSSAIPYPTIFASSNYSASVTSMMSAPATYMTVVVSQYTTYCPGPTMITHGGQTYTVTTATTLTITNCPCTITKPVETPTVTYYAPSSTYTPPVIYPTLNNVTTLVVSPTKYPTPSVSPFLGDAAGKSYSVAGVAAAALLGILAYL